MTIDIVEEMRVLEADHEPDGWPAVRMRKISALCDEVDRLRAKAARWDAIETLMILGDVELNQADDGGYSIYVEPAENVIPQFWEGDDPCQVIDKVVVKLAEIEGSKT